MVEKMNQQAHHIERRDWVEIGEFKKSAARAVVGEIESTNLFRKGKGKTKGKGWNQKLHK